MKGLDEPVQVFEGPEHGVDVLVVADVVPVVVLRAAVDGRQPDHVDTEFGDVIDPLEDAWKVADELKKRDIPVIVGPVMSLPVERDDPYDAPFANAGKLGQTAWMLSLEIFATRDHKVIGTGSTEYRRIADATFRIPGDRDLPVPVAVAVVAVLLVASIIVLERRVRGVEVVS